MAPDPRLSIVIVAYNSRAEIDGCLRTLRAFAPALSHEVIVVDNASADGTAAYVRERWPGVEVIDAGGNLGFAAANNRGIRQSAGELILLLNPDTLITAGALDALVATLDRHPEAAIAGPRLVNGDGHAELSFGAMIGPLAELRQKILVRGNDQHVPLIADYVERVTRRPQRVDWVSGACLLVRRSDAEAVGLMDERYFMYAEDVDFCAAIRARGRAVLFTPDATVTHLRGRSGATAQSATAAAYRRSQLAFYAKHHPAWLPLLRAFLKLTGRFPPI